MKNETAMAAPEVKKRKKSSWTRDDWDLALLGLPATIWFAVFAYLPMFGLIIAFKSFKLQPGMGFLQSLFASDWAGFKNFTYFLTSNTFSMLLRNTLLYNLVFIVLNLVIPVTLAIVINQLYSKIASKCYQTLMFFPYFMSWVVVSYFVYAFLSPSGGFANLIIEAFGGEGIMWYSSPQYWPFILVLLSTWKGMGYNMVVYLASITGIDTSLYEAAILDGATKWQQARYITIPTIRPMIIMMFILNIGHIFYSDFGLFYQVTQHIPKPLENVASTFDTFIFLALQSNADIGRTAAAGLFQSVCCCITVLITNAIVSKLDPDSAII